MTNRQRRAPAEGDFQPMDYLGAPHLLMALRQGDYAVVKRSSNAHPPPPMPANLPDHDAYLLHKQAPLVRTMGIGAELQSTDFLVFDRSQKWAFWGSSAASAWSLWWEVRQVVLDHCIAELLVMPIMLSARGGMDGVWKAVWHPPRMQSEDVGRSEASVTTTRWTRRYRPTRARLLGCCWLHPSCSCQVSRSSAREMESSNKVGTACVCMLFASGRKDICVSLVLESTKAPCRAWSRPPGWRRAAAGGRAEFGSTRPVFAAPVCAQLVLSRFPSCLHSQRLVAAWSSRLLRASLRTCARSQKPYGCSVAGHLAGSPRGSMSHASSECAHALETAPALPAWQGSPVHFDACSVWLCLLANSLS